MSYINHRKKGMGRWGGGVAPSILVLYCYWFLVWCMYGTHSCLVFGYDLLANWGFFWWCTVFFVNLSSCVHFLQFAIKWHDAWPMFFAQVTLRDLFMYLVFVSWCDNVHIFYSWLGTWSIHVLMYLYLSLIFIRMFSTNLGGNVKQYSMTEKKW